MNEQSVLYGIGLGPGAADLITLRAMKILQEEVDVIVAPRTEKNNSSLVLNILKKAQSQLQMQSKVRALEVEILELVFPMKEQQHELLNQAWDDAFEKIKSRLDNGLNVAFITEGDPSIYSTFSYILDRVKKRMPNQRVEIVPAVTSFLAASAILNQTLIEGEERLCVLPAHYGVEVLPSLLENFDTIVLTKVFKVLGELCASLEKQKMLDKAVYVLKATMDGEKICRDLRELNFEEEKKNYFSMVIIFVRKRKGILSGERE
ncbi:MAG: precorrin-2 C(20)-methyltransferase [Oligoflexia bacterium]|nr:precorrin-2 C(20)-methyltransferase [Oligoflexia bacterium]